MTTRLELDEYSRILLDSFLSFSPYYSAEDLIRGLLHEKIRELTEAEQKTLIECSNSLENIIEYDYRFSSVLSKGAMNRAYLNNKFNFSIQHEVASALSGDYMKLIKLLTTDKSMGGMINQITSMYENYLMLEENYISFKKYILSCCSGLDKILTKEDVANRMIGTDEVEYLEEVKLYIWKKQI